MGLLCQSSAGAGAAYPASAQLYLAVVCHLAVGHGAANGDSPCAFQLGDGGCDLHAI